MAMNFCKTAGLSMAKSFLALPRLIQDGMSGDFLESLFVGENLRKEGFREEKIEEKERC
jgi:hypothetical protein